MVPAFGFSVGDFVSAIGLTVKICKALREAGGASAECRMVIQDLQNLQQVLELLQDLRPAGASPSHVNAIRGVAITCLIPLKEFAEKIERSYGPIASASSSNRFLHRSGKKAQWSVFATEEVAKFRSVIAAKVASIGLLLSIFNIESLSKIETQNRESRDYLLAKSADHRDSLEKNLSELFVSHHNALSSENAEARKELKVEVVRIEEQTKIRHDDMLREADQHTNKLEGLSCQISQVQKDTSSNMRDIAGLCFGATAGAERRFRTAQQRSRKIEDGMKSIRERQNHMGSRMLYNFQSVFLQLKMMRVVGASLLGCLIPFSEKVLRYLRENMKANMEIYALLLKIQSSMPKQLNEGDKIHFEDVLGRTKTLPYEYFRHWEVFESMLRCEFKGIPGEEKVSQGQYLLMNGTSTKNRIEGEAWQQRVFPGTKVKMSVIMQKIGATSGFCPRSNCDGKVSGSRESTVHQCPVCNLEFVPQRPFYTKGQSLDVAKQSATGSSKREALNMPLGRMEILSDEGCIKERRKQRELKEREKAERELQEMMVFRMVHVSESFGDMQREPIPQEVETLLVDIAERTTAIVYNESDVLNGVSFFEDTYRNAYRLLLKKQGKSLYEKIATMIPAYVEDLVDYPLQQALDRADTRKSGFDAATLATISRIWHNFNNVFDMLTDILMYMVSISL